MRIQGGDVDIWRHIELSATVYITNHCFNNFTLTHFEYPKANYIYIFVVIYMETFKWNSLVCKSLMYRAGIKAFGKNIKLFDDQAYIKMRCTNLSTYDS